jgi:hemolysin activation/secretion protein
MGLEDYAVTNRPFKKNMLCRWHRSFFGVSCLVAIAIVIFLAAQGARAQMSLTEDTLDIFSADQEREFGFRAGSLILVPIPFSNPTIGNGLAGGGAWLFTADSGSKTSSIGLGGFVTDNDSSGYALGANLKLNDNRYLVSLLAGHVDLNYDFTAGFFDFPIDQTGDLYKLELAYGFTPELSAGIGLQYADTELSTTFGGVLPPEYTLSADLEVFKYGLIAEWDRRDSDIYPTKGTRVTFDAYQGEVSGDVGADYRKAVLQGSYFRRGFGADDVLGTTATGCLASDKAPFFDACSIGMTDGLRGFSVTEYIGESLISAQIEYRGRLSDSRLGYVAFAGAALVGGTRTSSASTNGAIGVGARYRLSKDFPVDFSVDATHNSDGETLYYIFVGQAF